MRNRLTVKFLLGYVGFAIFSFLLITFVSSWIIEQKTYKQTSSSLYDEATLLASYLSTTDPGLDSRTAISAQVSSASALVDADVWVVDVEGNILCDSSNANTGHTIDDFDVAAHTTGTYSVGTFYDMYREKVLTVFAPVHGNRTVSGYVVIHEAVSDVLRNRDETLSVVYMTGVIMFLASFVFVLMFRVMIGRPLQKIQNGVNEYSKGNLNYKIDIPKYDELGQLAATMNYMSGELRDLEDSQRKFVSNISHDFRSPLTTIKGYLEAMLDGTIPPEDQEHYLRMVVRETDRLTKITQSTLDLKTIEAKGAILNKEEFDVNELIRETAATFEGPCVARKIVIDITFDADELMVYADRTKIQQVLYNLIDNAIKYSEDERDIWIETYEKGETAYVSVKDSGCGIAPDDLKRIWTRFFKVDDSRGREKTSTGLGLSICRDIINNHGQTIDVISTEGVGTQFIFTLQKVAEEE